MSIVRAKKHLGQHFLTDKNIAGKIVDACKPMDANFTEVLEVGPGMGVLTDLLLQRSDIKLSVIDIDTESIVFLQEKYPDIKDNIYEGDFLKFDFSTITTEPLAIIGNFPYNISSQILFKIVDNRNQIPQMVGMFQKEVAERVAAKPNTKDYGILSVILQAFYQIEYLFTVNPGVFNPPPKVKSAVIRLNRKAEKALGCDEKKFTLVVRTAFNQRRKTMRNALGAIVTKEKLSDPIFDKRAEQLSVADFIDLTNKLYE